MTKKIDAIMKICTFFILITIASQAAAQDNKLLAKHMQNLCS